MIYEKPRNVQAAASYGSGRIAGMSNQTLWLTGDREADALLSEDDNALLIGMVLDQRMR